MNPSPTYPTDWSFMSVPPKTPESLAELERAIILLGSRAKGPLTKPRRKELIGLVGAYPDAAVASVWKASLKPLREDEIFGDAVD